MSLQLCMASCCSAAEANFGMQSPCYHDRGDSFPWVVCTMLGCRALGAAAKAPCEPYVDKAGTQSPGSSVRVGD